MRTSESLSVLIEQAINAKPYMHLAAIESTRCPSCGVDAGAQCMHGLGKSTIEDGKAHVRRVMRYLRNE